MGHIYVIPGALSRETVLVLSCLVLWACEEPKRTRSDGRAPRLLVRRLVLSSPSLFLNKCLSIFWVSKLDIKPSLLFYLLSTSIPVSSSTYSHLPQAFQPEPLNTVCQLLTYKRAWDSSISVVSLVFHRLLLVCSGYPGSLASQTDARCSWARVRSSESDIQGLQRLGPPTTSNLSCPGRNLGSCTRKIACFWAETGWDCK